jgi:hypothetical protein
VPENAPHDDGEEAHLKRLKELADYFDRAGFPNIGDHYRQARQYHKGGRPETPPRQDNRSHEQN